MSTTALETSPTKPARRQQTAPPPRIVVVGCGAIARAFHLPALAGVPGVMERLILADRDAGRVESARQAFGAHRAITDHRDALSAVDAAIIAVPQEFHAAVAREFLQAGIPVLCEKPLATTLAEATDLVATAGATGTVLAVNNTRRFYPSARAVREWIRSGRAGRIRRVEVYEGDSFGWPLASGTAFGRGGTGKGVLQDTGAHTLDMICWWLGERPEIIRYLDDAMGGSEAEARVELSIGTVHLSWLNRLSNTFRVEGERETLEGRILAWDQLRVTAGGRARQMKLRPDVPSFAQLNAHVIADFLSAVRGDGPPAVPGRDVLPSIGMIEECYSRRQRFAMPWHDTVQEVRNVVA
jgi:predicted dehydrogenase